MKIEKYIIISGGSESEIVKNINAHIIQRWQPYGSLQVIDRKSRLDGSSYNYYSQAMVWYQEQRTQ
jgi:hypothetical protein